MCRRVGQAVCYGVAHHARNVVQAQPLAGNRVRARRLRNRRGV